MVWYFHVPMLPIPCRKMVPSTHPHGADGCQSPSEPKMFLSMNHQTFQVPKMEVLSLIRLFLGWVFPYISRIHTPYIGEYLHFRYLKSLMKWISRVFPSQYHQVSCQARLSTREEKRSEGQGHVQWGECILSGQIIFATSHDRFSPKGSLVREIPGYFREI